jgi:hypothetical protein
MFPQEAKAVRAMEKKPLQYTYSYGQIEILEERLALAAIPLGPELQVNTYTTNTQSASVAAMDASGNAVIVWISERQNAGIRGIYGQRFDSSGMAVGGEFLIDESTSNSPDVAMTPTGEFIVTWSFRPIQTSSFEVYAKRFNAAGVQQGSAFQVNSYSLGDQRSSRIAMDDAGNFVIAWESEYQDGSSSGIYARRYNAVGTPLGAELRSPWMWTVTSWWAGRVRIRTGTSRVSMRNGSTRPVSNKVLNFR